MQAICSHCFPVYRKSLPCQNSSRPSTMGRRWSQSVPRASNSRLPVPTMPRANSRLASKCVCRLCLNLSCTEAERLVVSGRGVVGRHGMYVCVREKCVHIIQCVYLYVMIELRKSLEIFRKKKDKRKQDQILHWRQCH